MKRFSVKLFLLKGEEDFDGIVCSENRYIIVDEFGNDSVGEHYDIDEAIKVRDFLENDDND
jgi:hypothetical protein